MLKQQWNTWVRRRFRYQGAKQIKQNEVYVFLHPQGYLYIVLLLITFIAGINYANNLILGLCFLLSSILCLSFFMAFRQLYKLHIRLHPPAVLQAGEVDYLDLEIDVPDINASQQRWLSVILQDDVQHIYVSGKTQIRLNISPMKRGQYHLPLIQLRSTFPFGLVRAWSYVYYAEPIWVAPEALTLTELQYIHQQAIPLNRPDDFKELKQYQVGEALNMMSWKHVAQGKGMFVKVFEATEDDRVEINYDDFLHLDYETRLKVMMGLAIYYRHQNKPYALKIHHQALKAGIDADHFLQTQLILAQQP